MATAEPTGSVPLEALLAHREWVRALARSLVADPHRADDIEQETWRMAIERPPRHGASLRAWFATVVRNAARASGRRESLRRAVELPPDAGRGEAPSAAELVAEAELQHTLVRAVLDLDEPYRTTVLQRYFEGLLPVEIAARSGTPVDTVKTRLKRGIERLRERMDVAIGKDRDAWCLLLFGRRGPTPPDAPSLPRSASVALATKLVTALAVCLAVAGALWWTTRVHDGVRNASGETARAPAASDGEVAAGANSRRSGSVPASADDARSGELRLIVSARGAPARDALVETYPVPDENASRTITQESAARMHPPTASSSTRTDAQGAARLALGLSGRFLVVVRQRGFAPEALDVAAVDLSDGWTARVALTRGFPLGGRVLDAAGRGIAGASVVAEPAPEGWRGAEVRAVLAARGTTDEAGRFALADLAPGATSLFAARSGGFAACVAVADVPDVAAIDLFLDFDGALAGIVSDAATGTPLVDARVAVEGDDDQARCAAETTTDGSGAWRIDGLPIAGVVVTASKPGYLAVDRGEAARVRLANGRMSRCDLVLRRAAALAGRILSADGPVAGATVTAARAKDSGPRVKTVSVADGTYRFDALAAGEVFVVASVDGFIQPGFRGMWGEDVRGGTAPRACAVTIPASGEATLDVRVARGLSVAGRVLAPDGRPASPAVVALSYDDSCESDGPLRWQRTTAGSDGSFVFTGVGTTDTVRLDAWSVGGAAYDVKVPLAPSRGADGVELRLVASGRLVVHVSAPEGLDVADALVQSVDAQSAEHAVDSDPWRTAGGESVDATGCVSRDLAPADRTWLVRAMIPGRAWSEVVRVSVAADTEERRVELTLARGGAIEGRVANAFDGAPVAGARISVGRPLEERDRMIAISAWGSRPLHAKTLDVHAVSDAEGVFRLQGLPAGTYELAAAAEGFTTTTATLGVPAAGPFQIEMSPARRIHGVVRLADGRSVAPVRVTIHPWDDGTPNETRTAEDGTFAFEGLRDCAYYASVDPLPVGANVRPLDAGALRPREEPYEFVVESGAALAGRVIDVRGRPVADCRIQLYRAGTGPLIERFAGNHASARTDDEGRYAMQGLDPGPYVLLASPPRAAPGTQLAPARVDGVLAGASEVVVRLNAGIAIAGRIVDREGEPVAGVVVGLEPSTSVGPDPDACWCGTIRAPERTDASGAFRIEGLPACRCRAMLLGPSLALPSVLQLEGDCDVRAGDLDLRFVASGARTIAGVVADENGAPIAAEVTLTASDTAASQTCSAESSTGAFAFIELDAGRRYRVVAAPRSPELLAAHVEAEPGEHHADLRCAKGGHASARLLRADGHIAAKNSCGCATEVTRTTGSRRPTAQESSWCAVWARATTRLPPTSPRRRRRGGTGATAACCAQVRTRSTCA